jgi:Spy/CpxP family protein refolding chaperone
MIPRRTMMNGKKITTCVLGLFLIAYALSAAGRGNGFIQREELKKLSPKYRAFLAETRDFLQPDERKVFLGLDTDEQREVFIREFWEARRGWDNIGTLYLLRMVQVLDLSEEQTAKIFPKINRLEREKRGMNRKIGQNLRELRILVRQPNTDEEKMARLVDEIRDLRKQVRNREEELEGFLKENLTIYQQAKYLIFVQDFLRDLREKLNKARETIK